MEKRFIVLDVIDGLNLVAQNELKMSQKHNDQFFVIELLTMEDAFDLLSSDKVVVELNLKSLSLKNRIVSNGSECYLYEPQLLTEVENRVLSNSRKVNPSFCRFVELDSDCYVALYTRDKIQAFNGLISTATLLEEQRDGYIRLTRNNKNCITA